MLIDILLHRVPWNGDKIRLYTRTFTIGSDGGITVAKDELRGEFGVKIQDGDVLVQGRSYIRRDLPRWSERFGCWEYFYVDGNGS